MNVDIENANGMCIQATPRAKIVVHAARCIQIQSAAERQDSSACSFQQGFLPCNFDLV